MRSISKIAPTREELLLEEVCDAKFALQTAITKLKEQPIVINLEKLNSSSSQVSGESQTQSVSQEEATDDKSEQAVEKPQEEAFWEDQGTKTQTPSPPPPGTDSVRDISSVQSRYLQYALSGSRRPMQSETLSHD